MTENIQHLHDNTHTNFSGSSNYGQQIGSLNNPGTINYVFPPPPGKLMHPQHDTRGLKSQCWQKPTFAVLPEAPRTSDIFIPYPRDPDFVGRRTILDKIHDKRVEPWSRTSLRGLGGVVYVKHRWHAYFSFAIADVQMKKVTYCDWICASGSQAVSWNVGILGQCK